MTTKETRVTRLIQGHHAQILISHQLIKRKMCWLADFATFLARIIIMEHKWDRVDPFNTGNVVSFDFVFHELHTECMNFIEACSVFK